MQWTINKFPVNYEIVLDKQQKNPTKKIEYIMKVNPFYNQIAGQLFNKGVCFNIGFEQAMADYNYDCIVFHDVDIIAEDDRNFFTCGYQPRHLAVNVEQYGYK